MQRIKVVKGALPSSKNLLLTTIIKWCSISTEIKVRVREQMAQKQTQVDLGIYPTIKLM